MTSGPYRWRFILIPRSRENPRGEDRGQGFAIVLEERHIFLEGDEPGFTNFRADALYTPLTR